MNLDHARAREELVSLRGHLRAMPLNEKDGKPYTLDNVYANMLDSLERQIDNHEEFMARGGLDYDGTEKDEGDGHAGGRAIILPDER